MENAITGLPYRHAANRRRAAGGHAPRPPRLPQKKPRGRAAPGLGKIFGCDNCRLALAELRRTAGSFEAVLR